jgi:hypothetical protein
MSQVSRTTAKTYFNTGDIPTEPQFGNVLDSIPFFDDNAYTALTGTSWDGSPKRKQLTGDLAVTLSTSKRSGKMKIIQDGTGGHDLTINGVSIPVLPDPNAVTLVIFDFDDVASVYDFFVDTSYAGNIVGGGGGDTTAPVKTSIVVENATPTKLRIYYNETLLGSSVPANSDFDLDETGPGVGLTGTPVVGSDYIELTLSVAFVAGASHTLTYSGSSIKDLAGNNAATFSNVAVTNNIAGGGTGLLSGFTDLTFEDTTAALINTSRVYTADPNTGIGVDSSGHNNTGVIIFMQYKADSNAIGIGFQADDPASSGSVFIGMAYDGANIIAIKSGVGTEATLAAPTANTYYGIRWIDISGTKTWQVVSTTDGVTINVLHTFAYTGGTSDVWYPRIDAYTNTSKLYYPQIKTF